MFFYEFSVPGLIPAGLFPGSCTPAEPVSVCLCGSPALLPRWRPPRPPADELLAPLPFRAGTPRPATAPAAQRGCCHVPEVTAGGGAAPKRLHFGGYSKGSSPAIPRFSAAKPSPRFSARGFVRFPPKPGKILASALPGSEKVFAVWAFRWDRSRAEKQGAASLLL